MAKALTAKLESIPEPALAWFAMLVEGAGHARAEFVLLQLGGGAMFQASVVVRRVSTAAARTYAVGDGIEWIALFKRDLDGGVYGSP